MITVAALYQFRDFPNFKAHQQPLKAFCTNHGIKGTLLLAHEGINGTVSGTREAIDALQGYLKNTLGFDDAMEYKESQAPSHPFYRLKIKLKKEIVTLGKPEEANPNVQVGTYVDAEAWNKLIQDPTVTVIDTRNDYEYTVGTFKNAINPKTQSFREFPEYVSQLDPSENKRIAMFCTGGIRCEKASAYMLSQGFEEVYHLKGGILKYLEETPPSESLWEGECFVFDQRVALEHGVGLGHFDTCHGCRMPITEADKESELYEAGVSCPHCHSTLTPEKAARFRERQKQIQLAAAKGEKHMGRVVTQG
jgi:UPF0176 protein